MIFIDFSISCLQAELDINNRANKMIIPNIHEPETMIINTVSIINNYYPLFQQRHCNRSSGLLQMKS